MNLTPNPPGPRHLRAFDAVARTGSALAAARLLRVSQPAVTYSLNKLDRDFGVRLLDRNASGSFPTPPGAILQRRARRMFRQIVEAVAQATGESPDAAKTKALAAKLTEAEIRAVIAIWREGGFRAAARALAVAEPSLHRPARDIERLLRVSLYRRAAAGVEVNAAGAELARRLSLALDEIRSAIEEIGVGGVASRAGLRVGVLALTPRMILARATEELLSRFPASRVEIVEGAYETMATALRAGDVDLLFGALRAPPPYADLAEESLLEDPYAIVCREGHPLLAQRRVTLEQLADHDFIYPTQGLPRRAALDRLTASWGQRKQPRVDTNCLATIVAMLRATDRLTLLSRWHVGPDGLTGLRCLEGIDVPHEPRFVGLTTRRDWLPTPLQAGFIEILRGVIARRDAA